MQSSSIPGDIPRYSAEEVQSAKDSGEVQAPHVDTAPIDSTGHITVETPEYFIADTVGHLVDTIV